MLKRLIREPLLHFVALSLLVFAAYHVVGGEQTQRAGSITVSPAKIEQMTAVFAKTWQRAPTADELKGLIDDYVREEIYVREAMALGLDADDTVIRRRLRQKMEFLDASTADVAAPTDAELTAYLKAHEDQFRSEPRFAFEQVFFDPERHHGKLDETARSTLVLLASSTTADAAAVGDPTLLPAALPLTGKQVISQIFGPDFAEAVGAAKTGEWSGPVKSSYGLHLIRLTASEPSRVPTLAEARDAVLREWTNDKHQQAEKQRLEALLQRYDVKIQYPRGAGASP